MIWILAFTILIGAILLAVYHYILKPDSDLDYRQETRGM